MCRRFEGVTTWMYLDTKGLVTTGVGFLINTVAGAQDLPWQTKDGKPATAAQIKTEWTRVHNQQTWKKFNGLNSVWRNSAFLSLPMDTVDAKLLETTERFWKRLAQGVPMIDLAPADAQLALMDEAWQNGPAFLDKGTIWTNTRAGVVGADWSRCASAVPGNAGSDRKEARIRLFKNAAKVVALRINPEILWDTKTPVANAVPAPAPTPDPTPEVSDVPIKYAPRHGAALAKYAKSRVGSSYGVGWCQKFTNECGQTGSVGDWDGDKAADAEDGWKKATAKGKVVKASAIKDWSKVPEGVYHYWTGGGSDHGHAAVGVGGRKIVSTDMTDSGPRYGKIGLCDAGSPARYWGITYAGYALIEGNGYTLTDPPNDEGIDMTPDEFVTAMLKDPKLVEKVAAAVYNADIIPNLFTTNKANKTVSGFTAFDRTGKRLPPLPEPTVPPTTPTV